MYGDDFDPYNTVDFEKSCEPVSLDNVIDEPLETDVEGIKANAYYSKGMDSFPIFDVDFDTFQKNYSSDNRFNVTVPDDSTVQKYMDNTNNRSEFYLRYKSDDGIQLKKVR